MPLQPSPKPGTKHASIIATERPSAASKRFSGTGSLFSVMKTKSRALISVPVERVRPKSQQSEESAQSDRRPEVPKLTIDDVESSLNMSQVNGYFRDSPVETSRIPSQRVVSPSILKSASLSLAAETSTPVQEPAWSSAVGHASTGKSGRVIERLQGDIDRLHREKQLLKVQFEEAEKANETLATRNQYLQDRNSNYEHSHETNVRQLERKERQLQELRDEIKKEKVKTTRAEEQARAALTDQEGFREKAEEADARALQREIEYNAIVACRKQDNDRHQGGLEKLRAHFTRLSVQREQDLEKQKKLEIIAEQQRQTIEQLEELTRKLSVNFKQYRTEIDSAIADLRDSTSDNDLAMRHKLEEMRLVTGQMKWVMNVEHDVNHRKTPPMPASFQGHSTPEQPVEPPVLPFSTSRKGDDAKPKHSRKKSSKNVR